MTDEIHYCTKCLEEFQDIYDLDDHLIEEHNAPQTFICWACRYCEYRNWFHLQKALEEHLKSEAHKEEWGRKSEYHREHSLDTTRAEIPLIKSWALGRHSDLVCDKMRELFVGSRRLDPSNQVEITEEEYDIIRRLGQEESKQKRYSCQLKRYRDETLSSPSTRRIDTETRRELDAAIRIDRQLGQVQVHPERRTIIQRAWHAEFHPRPLYGGGRVPQVQRDPSVGCYEKLVQQQRKIVSDRLQATYNMLSPSRGEKESLDPLQAPKEKSKHHIKLQSDLARLGYTNRIKARLDLPKDYNPQAFTILTLDFSSITLTPKSHAIPLGDVVTRFGFADDLVLNRHSQDFYKSHEMHEDEDHDQFALGKSILPHRKGKQVLRNPIYPPHTGKRERYGGHSVQSETMIEYLSKHPQAQREPGDLEGLPNPVVPRNKNGVFMRDAFLRKEIEVETKSDDEDGMDVDLAVV